MPLECLTNIENDNELIDLATTNNKKTDYKTNYRNASNVCLLQKEVFPYEKLNVIGKGVNGVVVRARNKKTHQMVALKRILNYDIEVGLSENHRAEEDILGLLNYKHVVSIFGSCIERRRRMMASYYIALELCHVDLAGLLGSPYEIYLGHKKNIIKQILLGLQYIHEQKVMHLDLKPQNILITKTGVVKLADFGLAQQVNPDGDQPNNNVVTQWYRSPELILGKMDFGPAVDMWSAGCLMAELWTRYPILQGSDDQDQLYLITSLCGSFSSDGWPELVNLNKENEFKLMFGFKRKVKQKFKYLGTAARDLLDQLLIVDPSVRIDAKAALNHVFFSTAPHPRNLRDLL